ncbi:hypothetical protein [Bandra megavirus]|uniref:RNA ligase domain-containing protein n=1 Tax=Bandra megavirus TaxID=2071566 RepID=A0A2K9V8U4_9VIRU|nr:hypothetical protein [Bandra megavirus]
MNNNIKDIIRFYPSINSLSDIHFKKDIKDFYIEEKIDGSQMSLIVHNDKLVFFNKNKIVDSKAQVYQKAIIMLQTIKSKFKPGLIYSGEVVNQPKANVAVYDRVPDYFFILYDIYCIGENRWYNYQEKHEAAKIVGLECVPQLYCYQSDNDVVMDIAKSFIDKIESGELKSCLGGIPEGIVIKRAGTKLKVVSGIFKERHLKKQHNHIWTLETSLKHFGDQFNVNARFQKAYQHLAEDDCEINLQTLIVELDKDLEKEYNEEIKAFIKAQCIGHINKAYQTDENPKKYNDKEDLLRNEVLETTRKIKINLSTIENIDELYDHVIFNSINYFQEKFKPIIFQSARSGLNKWFSEKLNQ